MDYLWTNQHPESQTHCNSDQHLGQVRLWFQVWKKVLLVELKFCCVINLLRLQKLDYRKPEHPHWILGFPEGTVLQEMGMGRPGLGGLSVGCGKDKGQWHLNGCGWEWWSVLRHTDTGLLLEHQTDKSGTGTLQVRKFVSLTLVHFCDGSWEEVDIAQGTLLGTRKRNQWTSTVFHCTNRCGDVSSTCKCPNKRQLLQTIPSMPIGRKVLSFLKQRPILQKEAGINFLTKKTHHFVWIFLEV